MRNRKKMDELRELAPLWTVLGMVIVGLGAIASIPLRGTAFERYATQVPVLCFIGILICLAVAPLALALEPLRRLSRWLGRVMRTSARFLLENLLVASVLLNILVLLLLGILLRRAAYAAIAGVLVLANVGLIIGILRTFGSRYGIDPSAFFDSFDKGLSRWKSLHSSTAARIRMPFQGRAHCLEMPAYTHQQPEIIYVAGLDDWRNGIIECDVYLPTNALINVLFRADIPGHYYYGARLDTRPQRENGYPLYNKFLRRDGNGPQSWFQEGPHKGTKTSPNQWHHMKVVVAEDVMQLYLDEELVASWADSKYPSGQLGIMAELTRVYIDNFRITRLPDHLRIGGI